MNAKKTGKKGFETEEVLRSYFLGAGFFVLRGVLLRHGNDDLTDIDLWLYERSATLARRRIIIDIKDNAQPKAAERLFFVKGLAEVIQVEATGVATSDSRRSLRELARKHNVLWIDNADLQRLKTSQKLAASSRLTEEELKSLILQVDNLHSSRRIRDAFETVKSSVADRFGPASANTALEGTHMLARMVTESHPDSLATEIATRLTYFCTAVAAVALDFASGESALRTNQERIITLTEAIRLGDDPKGTAEKLRWTEAAVRDFAPSGGAGLAETIRRRFNEALSSVPAEGLAEVVVKMGNSDRLFKAARDLESAAYSNHLAGFDGISIEAKTILGAVLDFVGVDRVRFSTAWTKMPSSNNAPVGQKVSELPNGDVDQKDQNKLSVDGKLL